MKPLAKQQPFWAVAQANVKPLRHVRMANLADGLKAMLVIDANKDAEN